MTTIFIKCTKCTSLKHRWIEGEYNSLIAKYWTSICINQFISIYFISFIAMVLSGFVNMCGGFGSNEFITSNETVCLHSLYHYIEQIHNKQIWI